MSKKTPRKKTWDFLHREPLVHFLLGACILFLLQAIFAPDSRDQVLISRATVDYLIEQEEYLRLRPLSAQERQDVINLLIEEELLVREARKLGFENSSRIRSLLIQNMRVFLSKGLPEPSDEDLRTFYEANPDQFSVPPRYSINHVSFRDPPAALDDVLDRLMNGADPATLGDEVPGLGVAIPGRSAAQLSVLFGPDIAREIAETKDDAWHGPMPSNYGVHFIQVTERRTARQMQFEEVAGSLRPMANIAARKQRFQDYIQGIQDSYDIIYEDGVQTPDKSQ
jgi:parvulin-like peptidyl-prolyl isomerase